MQAIGLQAQSKKRLAGRARVSGFQSRLQKASVLASIFSRKQEPTLSST